MHTPTMFIAFGRGPSLASDAVRMLDILAPRSLAVEWQLERIECIAVPREGENACQELYRYSDLGERRPGTAFRKLLARITQWIEGSARGYARGETQEWVAIIAVDGEWYDIRWP